MSNIINIREVARRVGLSRTSIWRRERSGNFPERLRLGGRRVGWREDEIDSWLDSRPRGMTDPDPSHDGER